MWGFVHLPRGCSSLSHTVIFEKSHNPLRYDATELQSRIIFSRCVGFLIFPRCHQAIYVENISVLRVVAQRLELLEGISIDALCDRALFNDFRDLIQMRFLVIARDLA